MNAIRFNRYSLTVITLSAFLAGCGGTQHALSLAPSPVTPNAAHVSHGKCKRRLKSDPLRRQIVGLILTHLRGGFCRRQFDSRLLALA